MQVPFLSFDGLVSSRQSHDDSVAHCIQHLRAHDHFEARNTGDQGPVVFALRLCFSIDIARIALSMLVSSRETVYSTILFPSHELVMAR